MTPISVFTLGPTDRQKSPDDPVRSRLFFQTKEVQSDLRGAYLEGQFEVDGKYLLLLTDDIPYEETLSFCLLSSSLKIEDEAYISAPYAPGLLTNIDITGSRELEFSFYNLRWKLAVTPARARASKYLKRSGGRILRQRFLELSRIA